MLFTSQMFDIITSTRRNKHLSYTYKETHRWPIIIKLKERKRSFATRRQACQRPRILNPTIKLAIYFQLFGIIWLLFITNPRCVRVISFKILLNDCRFFSAVFVQNLDSEAVRWWLHIKYNDYLKINILILLEIDKFKIAFKVDLNKEIYVLEFK